MAAPTCSSATVMDDNYLSGMHTFRVGHIVSVKPSEADCVLWEILAFDDSRAHLQQSDYLVGVMDSAGPVDTTITQWTELDQLDGFSEPNPNWKAKRDERNQHLAAMETEMRTADEECRVERITLDLQETSFLSQAIMDEVIRPMVESGEYNVIDSSSEQRSLVSLIREARTELAALRELHTTMPGLHATLHKLLLFADDYRPSAWRDTKTAARAQLESLPIDARIAFRLLLDRLDMADRPSGRGCSAAVVILDEADVCALQAELRGRDPYAEALAQIPGHPPTNECPDMECMVCGMRDCPQGAPEHYWHDGCPSCHAPQLNTPSWPPPPPST